MTRSGFRKSDFLQHNAGGYNHVFFFMISMAAIQNINRLWFPFTYYQDTLDYPPVVIERGAGIYITDISGRTYIDAIGSWWVSLFGHNHPHITEAVKEQADKLEHVLMAGFVSEPALRLADLLGDLLPKKLTRIFYSDNGSTAVEVALKMALQYHSLRDSKASEFVGLGGAYHGDTLGAVSVSDIPSFHGIFHRRFKKHHSAHSPYCYRCPVKKQAATCGAECMDSLAKLLRERHKKIAACIFEPMLQGAAVMRVYPAKVLKRIFSLCKKYGVLTIADEVATGFGRTGRLFACEHAGVVPDIMCLAKGLTAGYLPMAVTAAQEHVFEEFKGSYGSDRILFHGHSFTGNPLAASAACASMELVKKLDIPASLKPVIAHFQKGLKKFSRYDVVGDVRHIGMVGAIEFVRDRKSKAPFPHADRFTFTLARRALERGLLVRPLGEVLYFMPALTITAEQIDNMFALLHESIKDVLGARPAV
jgi:adenosylmethionine-8-amino-7-oxononanoate aminotransferase